MRHHKKDRAHHVFVTDLILLIGLMQLKLRFDVAVWNFQAYLVAPAYEGVPDELSTQSLLQGVLAGAAGCKYLRQFLAVYAHVLGNTVERIVHVRIVGLEAIALGLT